MNIPGCARRTLAVMGAVAVTMCASMATSADAATGIRAGQFFITDQGGGYYWLQMTGYIPMSQADAQGYLNNGAFFRYDVYVKDWFSDDHIIGPIRAGGDPNIVQFDAHAELNGLHTSVIYRAHCSTLDDDWGPDAIYYRVRFVDGDGAAISATSKVVEHEYEC